jgi:hypothetical protein
MTIDLVPLSLFSERHKEGWRMRPGYELKAGDYAVLMQSPDHDDTVLNTTRASVSRNYARASRPGRGEHGKFKKIKACGT